MQPTVSWEQLAAMTTHLSPKDKLRLAQRLLGDAEPSLPEQSHPRRHLSELRGLFAHPLCSEDAQSWVSRSRRDDDEQREAQLRPSPVTIANALATVRLLFLDTAPLIYYVERNPTYTDRVDDVFQRIDNSALDAVASPVTLAECLVHPYKRADTKNINAFCDVILHVPNLAFINLNAAIAQHAAELRARYALTLTDAFQVAAALAARCDAILTNDHPLKKVTEIPVLVLDHLTL